MASRTYLPTLKALLKGVCAFITKYRDRIVAVVGSENEDKVDAVVLACNTLMPILDTFIPDGN